MNNIQAIKNMLLPYLKGAPFIIVLVIIAVTMTYRALNYVVPKYESAAKLRIESSGDGVVNSLDLYDDFNVFSVAGEIKTEVEVLKSDILLSMVVDKMGEEVRYYRIGDLRTSEMYTESPFLIADYKLPQRMYNTPLSLRFTSDSLYVLSFGAEQYAGKACETLQLDDGWLHLQLKEDIIKQKGMEVLQGDFYCKVLDHNTRVSSLKKSLSFTNMDKDVPIVRISCKDEVPERAAKAVNLIAKCYIEDYVSIKSQAAEITYNFISEQLEVVAKKLSDSEIAIENFKKDYNVVNTRQETETGLRELSQLQLNLIALQIEREAMDSVLSNLDHTNTYKPIVVNFEGFSDLTYTETIKEVNELLSKRKRLLLSYQESHEEVRLVESQIIDLKQFLKEGMERSRQSIKTKIISLEREVTIMERQFDDLPEREKKLLILERDFLLNQKIYNFLSEKRVESSIAQAATIAFHRIIEYGSVADKPVSPNKSFLAIVAGFLVVLVSILLIYIKSNFASRTQSRTEVEKQSAIPVLGIVPKMRKGSDQNLRPFNVLITEMLAREKLGKHQILSVTSASRKEGKSFVSQHLAQGFANLGWNTLLVDYNPHHPSLSQLYGVENEPGLLLAYANTQTIQSAVVELEEHLSLLPYGNAKDTANVYYNPEELALAIAQLKSDYDIIIVDTPANTITNEAVMLIQESDYALQVIRSGKTHTHMVQQADQLAHTYDLENINLLINYTPKAFNYNGMLTGSRYSYSNDKGFASAARRYINTYLR